MQRSPSSWVAQSASAWQAQTFSPAQAPPTQTSSLVQLSPSSHGSKSGAATIAHLPVLGAQVFLLQAVSPACEQLTTVLGSSSQVPFCLLQNSVPLQRLPSSLAAQSLSCWHWQRSAEGVQTPALQTSPTVQALASSQAKPSATGVSAHRPVLGWQRFLRQSVSSTVGHCTTVAGLCWHSPVWALQKSVPLQKSPSSNLAQSVSALHWAMEVPGTQAPAWQASPTVLSLPSSQAVPSGASPRLQAPVLASHAAVWQAEAGLGQVTTLAGLTLQVKGSAEVSQKSVPLQALPSS